MFHDTNTNEKALMSWFWDMPLEFRDRIVLSKTKRLVMAEPISPTGEWWIRFTSMLNIQDIFDEMKTFMTHGSYSIPADARKKTLLIRFNATWGRFPPGYSIREFIRRLRFRGFTVVVPMRKKKQMMLALELRPEARTVPRYRVPAVPEVVEPRNISEAYKILGVPSGTPVSTLRAVGKHILATWHPDRYPGEQKKFAVEMFKKKSMALTYLLRELAEADGEMQGYGFGTLTLRR